VRKANSHYSGNKSLFLRTAIEDHSQTLEGKDEFRLKSLITEVESLVTAVESLQSQVDKKSIQEPHVQYSGKTTEQPVEDDRQVSASAKRSIHQVFLNSEEQFTLSEIAESVDAGSTIVHEAVMSLLKQGYIKKISTDRQTKFKLDLEGPE
jgi:hypothetical protein